MVAIHSLSLVPRFSHLDLFITYPCHNWVRPCTIERKPFEMPLNLFVLWLISNFCKFPFIGPKYAYIGVPCIYRGLGLLAFYLHMYRPVLDRLGSRKAVRRSLYEGISKYRNTRGRHCAIAMVYFAHLAKRQSRSIDLTTTLHFDSTDSDACCIHAVMQMRRLA
jgi:hypothetical protein